MLPLSVSAQRPASEGAARAATAGPGTVEAAEGDASLDSAARGRGQEARLLFALAGVVRGGGTAFTPRVGFDWARLLQLAWDEGATARLRDFFRVLPRGRVPAEVERQLALIALDREMRMRILEQRAIESVASLRLHGIDVALLKGAALAATVYGSFTARPMNDIDLLVAPEDAERARELMLDSGWERDPSLPGDAAYSTHHHLAPLIDACGSRSRLEIHRALLPPGHAFALSSTDVWKHMQPAPIGRTNAFVLDGNLHAIHLAIHFAWSHTMRAGAWHAFRDLGSLQRERLLDWDRLISLAIEVRAASCCYWTFLLARQMSGLDVPDDVLEALAPDIAPALRSRLERHFVHVLLRQDSTHLSLRLDRSLWNLAIQPEQQGHGEARPWLVSAELTAARSRHDTTSAGQRVLTHVDRVARCSAYVARLLWN
jgi:hypothetical protein